MFKIDKKSLEKLSFGFGEKDIAHLKATLEYLNSNNLLTIPPKEFQNALQGLDAIGKLKLDGKIYGFHIWDSCAANQGSYGGEGVELRLRQGDRLEEFLVPGSRDFVYDESSAISCLKDHKISKIYTGDIPRDSSFLGLTYECDEDDPIITTRLDDHDIDAFQSEDIKVVVLDSLI